MPAGDSLGSQLSAAERFSLDDTIRKAEQLSRVEFSVFVGNATGEPRAFATRLHNTLVAPAVSILIMVDPTTRSLEIVTGGQVRRTLLDKEVELAALHMRTAFTEGDLVGGLKRGIQLLADHARPPQTLHAGT